MSRRLRDFQAYNNTHQVHLSKLQKTAQKAKCALRFHALSRFVKPVRTVFGLVVRFVAAANQLLHDTVDLTSVLAHTTERCDMDALPDIKETTLGPSECHPWQQRFHKGRMHAMHHNMPSKHVCLC